MQHHIKKYTKCGGLTMFFTIFIIMFGVSSTALTTFGKSPPQPPAPTNPPVKAKECNTNQECVGIPGTSCVKDWNDLRKKCLCGDNSAPVNGLCNNRYKGLYHLCKESMECDLNMVCRQENVTKTTLGQVNKISSNEKYCLCDEENGYELEPKEHHCNAAMSNFFMGIFGYFAAIVFYFVITQKVLSY